MGMFVAHIIEGWGNIELSDMDHVHNKPTVVYVGADCLPATVAILV